MLPAPHRLRRRRDFDVATRRGRRAGSGTLVVHLAAPPAQLPGREHARVGFVVSRTCGPAVARNKVRRRLRHLVLDRLADLPAGAVVVVRALPAAAEAGRDRMEADLARCLDRVLPPGAESAPKVGQREVGQ